MLLLREFGRRFGKRCVISICYSEKNPLSVKLSAKSVENNIRLIRKLENNYKCSGTAPENKSVLEF